MLDSIYWVAGNVRAATACWVSQVISRWVPRPRDVRALSHRSSTGSTHVKMWFLIKSLFLLEVLLSVLEPAESHVRLCDFDSRLCRLFFLTLLRQRSILFGHDWLPLLLGF